MTFVLSGLSLFVKFEDKARGVAIVVAVDPKRNGPELKDGWKLIGEYYVTCACRICSRP